MEYSAELQLEKELAQLLHPEARLSYDENGNYWYMNHATKPMPNFLGYVPRYSRNNDSAFEVMVLHRCFPIRLAGGVAVMDELGRERIAEEMFEDHMGSYLDSGTDFERSELKATRFVILRAAIHKLKKAKK